MIVESPKPDPFGPAAAAEDTDAKNAPLFMVRCLLSGVLAFSTWCVGAVTRRLFCCSDAPFVSNPSPPP